MVHLKAMHDENHALLCGDLETKGTDVSFMDFCKAAKLIPVGCYGGSLTGSQHDATIGVQITVCKPDLECIIIWVNVIFQFAFSVVDLKILMRKKELIEWIGECLVTEKV